MQGQEQTYNPITDFLKQAVSPSTYSPKNGFLYLGALGGAGIALAAHLIGAQEISELSDLITPAAVGVAGAIATGTLGALYRRSQNELEISKIQQDRLRQGQKTTRYNALTEAQTHMIAMLKEEKKHRLQTARPLLKRLGDVYDFGKAERDGFETALVVYDCGKYKIDSAILNKKGKPTDYELGQIRKIPELSLDMLRQHMTLDSFILDLVVDQSERVDGTGPLGKGAIGYSNSDNLPLASRVFRVVLDYLMMLEERPYRSAKTPDEALVLLRENMGQIYDQDVVEKFYSCFDRSLYDASNVLFGGELTINRDPRSRRWNRSILPPESEKPKPNSKVPKTAVHKKSAPRNEKKTDRHPKKITHRRKRPPLPKRPATGQFRKPTPKKNQNPDDLSASDYGIESRK